MPGRSGLLVVLVAVSALALVLAAEVGMSAAAAMEARAKAEVAHYSRLWASNKHTANVHGKKAWLCCRACPQGTVPFMHEEFEGDKNDMPPPAPSPTFLELARAESDHKPRRDRDRRDEFDDGAEYDDKKSYSCCNQCPDLMAPFPRTWNDPSPYSYRPKRLFRDRARFQQKHLGAEDAVMAELSTTVDKSGAAASEKWPYEPTNPHDLPSYFYYESTQLAGPARSPAARDGKWDKPKVPGAAPIWHPPPPPHDDIYRMSRSPNLHDGFDLKTEFVMPPCCDFCMSTYFPQIINDELQLPRRVPYEMAKVSFAETDASTTDDEATADSESESESETETDTESSEDADASLMETSSSSSSSGDVSGGASGGNEFHEDPNRRNIPSSEMLERLQPAAKSNPEKCCHKCVRKDIEDTDWHVFALPADHRRHNGPLKPREKPPRSRW